MIKLFTATIALCAITSCMHYTSHSAARMIGLATSEGYRGHIKEVREEICLATERYGTFLPDTTSATGALSRLVSVKQYDRNGIITSRCDIDAARGTTTTAYTYPTANVQEIAITQPMRQPASYAPVTTYSRKTYHWLNQHSYSVVYEVYNNEEHTLKHIAGHDTVTLDTTGYMVSGTSYTPTPYGHEEKTTMSRSRTADTITQIQQVGDMAARNITTYTILAKDEHGNATATLCRNAYSTFIMFSTYQYY